MVRTFRIPALATVSALALIAATGAAMASSFAVRSGQGAEGLGLAYAGGASGGIGMSSIVWNPATITMAPGRQSNWNFTYLRANASYEINPFTAAVAQGLGGTPVGTGNIGGDGAFIPASYSSWQLTDRLWIGMATGAPWGLRSKPDNQAYAGQIYGRSARIGSMNFSPTVGYQVNDWLAVGATMQVQYLKARLSNALGMAAAAPNAILEGDAWAVGYRLGATLTPLQGTTIGLAYRSSLRHELDGDFKTPVSTTPIKAALNLPDSVTFGVSQVINDQWQAHLGVEWTNWSRFRRIPVVNELNGAPLTGLNFEYNDSWYFSVGAEYQYSAQWTFRAGIAYELSAVDDRVRTVVISDNDRLWLSVGASYKWNDRFKFDIGYTHIFVNDATVNYGPGHPQFRPTVPVPFQATAKPYIDIVSVGITYRWDDPAKSSSQPLVRKF
jgi:long-chain fatty acid transport protein